MKKILFVLFLLGLVMAQDELLGCTITDTQVVCPKTMEVSQAQIELSEDFTCGELGFDYDFEDMGCYGQASIINDVSFESCQVFAPLLPNKEVDYENINQNKNCVQKTWNAGNEVTVLIEREYLGNCQKTEGDEFYQYDKCKAKGKKLVVSGVVTEEEGVRYLAVSTAEEKTLLFNNNIIIAVIVLAIIAFFFLTRKKKKR